MWEQDWADWAENLYSNWFLADANACWTSAAQGELADCGYIEGPERQDEFYWHVLPTFVGSAKTTVVIVSDALRYEVACDVAALLERERGGNVKVSSMQAVFPSITEVGMPRCCRIRRLGLQRMVRLCWLTASPPQRLRNARPCLPMLSLRPALYARAHTSTWREPSVRRCSRTQDLSTSTTTRSSYGREGRYAG